MSSTDPDIGHLLSNPSGDKPATGRRFAFWLLPLAILLGFALIFGLLFRDRLLPAKAVPVAHAVGIEEALENEIPQGETTAIHGDLLFQASGWVEPDPLPVKVTALTDGVVEEVFVYEGELVEKGDLIATLIGIDTRLERDAKAADLADVKASFEAHCTGTQTALKQMDAEKAQLAIAEANAAEAADKLQRYERLTSGAIPADEMQKVRYDHTRSLAEIDNINARIAGIAENLNKIAFEVQAIQARIQKAEIDLEKAELAHSRTRITAPINGRVLKLVSAPGQKKMLGMDDMDSATIAILYDPRHLQVRVDVPLADAAGLGVGQTAKIRCNLLPDEVFEGEVTRIEGSADLQRNTLQAKVRIKNPNGKLRPEMLSRVEFFEIPPKSEGSGKSEISSAMGVAVYVPDRALSGGSVWICDPETSRAESRSVTFSEKKGGLVRIDSGLRPGEWVVLDATGVRAGQRLKPIFND
ncbi:efflux RND transporter periplasmic adaptor subunit [Luteolibacter algae]|uniref:Efflux RND transporter periplasmic adaptor subunit n=1 Tax=Luteolibacter algae TaxID=454151 RepID=A0ABW5D6K7_9BACT